MQWANFKSLNLNSEDLENFMIHKAQLFLDEGYIFGDVGKGFERFNVAVPTRVIEEALKRLDNALKEL